MVTQKENILTMFGGRKPTWVPCSINLAQWYTHHRNNNILPEELKSTVNPTDVLKIMGCDIFSRNLDGGVRECFEGVETHYDSMPRRQATQYHSTIVTPKGTLRAISEDQPELSTSYHVEYYIKDWQVDRAAYLWALERKRFYWDKDAFSKTYQQVNDFGIVLVPAGCTPLKQFHKDFGLDHSCLFLFDYPDDARHIADMYWQQLWPVFQALAEDDRVHAAILMDNVDSPFYPPSLCRDYWTPYVRQAVDLFEAKGKRIFVHACCKLKGLKAVFNEAGVHGLEGMAHPPLGDFMPADLRDMHGTFIFNGGFSAHEQTAMSDAQLAAFYEQFFKEMNGVSRFVFAAACQTAINTPWERIKLAVNLCRRFGGQPDNITLL